VGRAGESTVSKQEELSKNPQYGSTSDGAVLLVGGDLASQSTYYNRQHPC
jgi:hypothetical protein